MVIVRMQAPVILFEKI